MRRSGLIFPLIALAAFAVSCGGDEKSDGSDAGTGTFSVQGTLTLTSESVTVDGLSDCIATSEELFADDCNPTKGTGCAGNGGFADIAGGAQVKVADSGGDTVALGELGEGTLNRDAPDWQLGEAYVCTFSLAVEKVPDHGDIFSVEVAGRDPFSFSKDDAADLALNLGD